VAQPAELTKDNTMNDQDKIAEQAAEITNLHLVLAERQAKIAELMGEAARAALPVGIVARDLMPKRSAFIAWCEQRGLETVEDQDAWGKRKFKHSHIEALWEGWFNAPDGLPVDRNAVPSGDILRAIVRSASTSASDGASPQEYVLAGWSAAIKSAAPTSVPQLAVPNGYKLVPIEPTEAMLDTGNECWMMTDSNAKGYYRAMLAAAPLPEQTGPSEPNQPLVIDKHGAQRFRANALVNYLLDNGPFNMNDLAEVECSVADREQFAQLIGYSLSGYGELSYVTDERYYAAQASCESPAPAQQQEPSAAISATLLRAALKAAELGRGSYHQNYDGNVLGHAIEELLASVETAAPGASIGDAEPASTDCTYCYGLGEVQGQGSYADFEPPINKCSQCDGTGKA
jgi:hypothetical protein